MTSPTPESVTRRRFLAGTGLVAGAALLAACSSSDSGSAGATSTTAAGSGLALAQFFGGLPMLAAGAEVRAPFGMTDAQGLLPPDKTPAELTVAILGAGGAPVGDSVVVQRRAEGLPRGYYPLRFTVPEPGIFTARTEVDGEVLEMAIKVDAAADVAVIQRGAPLPSLTTPTTSAPAGVDPICTNDPVCSLHSTTADDARAQGRPLALLVATPAYCQVAICGPVLDVLLGVVAAYPDITFLHEEVYAQPAHDLDVKAPVVEQLGLAFEPCLVLVGSDGRVAERLDTIYDASELHEVLARLT